MLINKVTLIALLATSLLMAKTSDTFKLDCKKNDALACYQYGLPLISGENRKIDEISSEGYSYMKKACMLNEGKGCSAMAEHYYEDAHYHVAIPYFEQACESNITSSCEKLGIIYRDGKKAPHDDTKMRHYFTQACALKSGDACYNVAIIYRGGFGVEQNRSKEKSFYKQACDAKLKVGCERFTELDNEDKGIETGIMATIKSWFK